MNKNSLLLGLCALSLVACSKTSPLLENNPEFIGQWKSTNSTLNIEKDGDSQYTQQQKIEQYTASEVIQSKSRSKMTSKLTQLDQQQLKIGDGAWSKRFIITQAPHQVEGHWQMQLDHELYTRD